METRYKYKRSLAQSKPQQSDGSEIKEDQVLTKRIEKTLSSEHVLTSPDNKNVQRFRRKEAPITSPSSSESKYVKSDEGEYEEQISPDNVSSAGESEDEMEKEPTRSEKREAGKLGGKKREPGGLGKDERDPAGKKRERQENKEECQLTHWSTGPTIISMFISKFVYSTHPLEFLFCFLLALFIKLKSYTPKDELDWLLFVVVSMVTVYAIGFNILLIIMRWIKQRHILYRIAFMISAVLFVPFLSDYVDSTNSPVRYIYNPYKAVYYLAPFFNK